ncbi:hypothetical protein BN873_10198 [Candidatus Competibacter denitrificans Run_A_D11]|uniref:Uncharacterized protein n=1 Tax=Candidatus Competibacter denitrificans Run_A_D11 TaxID=1400863 RepID=W6M0L6_9GAMM|nr:hypothetical protein BN873_10198 [Candidatus Competibacter denitrificans Run_A_D11]
MAVWHQSPPRGLRGDGEIHPAHRRQSIREADFKRGVGEYYEALELQWITLIGIIRRYLKATVREFFLSPISGIPEYH